jgi:hypothetical protein
MNQQDELEALRASESIKHANLQELARLVLHFSSLEFYIEPKDDFEDRKELDDSISAMIDFAKGVAQ